MTYLRRNTKAASQATEQEIKQLLAPLFSRSDAQLLSQNKNARPIPSAYRPIQGDLTTHILKNHIGRLRHAVTPYTGQGLEAMRQALRKKGVVGV